MQSIQIRLLMCHVFTLSPSIHIDINNIMWYGNKKQSLSECDQTFRRGVPRIIILFF